MEREFKNYINTLKANLRMQGQPSLATPSPDPDGRLLAYPLLLIADGQCPRKLRKLSLRHPDECLFCECCGSSPGHFRIGIFHGHFALSHPDAISSTLGASTALFQFCLANSSQSWASNCVLAPTACSTCVSFVSSVMCQQHRSQNQPNHIGVAARTRRRWYFDCMTVARASGSAT